MLLNAVTSDTGRLRMATYSELFHHALTIGTSSRNGASRELRCYNAFAHDAPPMILSTKLSEAQEVELMKLLAHIFLPLHSALRNVHAVRKLVDGWTSAKKPTVAEVVGSRLKALRESAYDDSGN